MKNKKVVQAALVGCVAVLALRVRKARKRRLWTKKWLHRRVGRSSYQLIFKELKVESPIDFLNYTRMSPELFASLLRKVEPFISKKETHLRASISAGARLEATLRFLATGSSYTSLQYSTRISKQSLSSIVPETCQAIYQALKEEHMQVGGKVLLDVVVSLYSCKARCRLYNTHMILECSFFYFN